MKKQGKITTIYSLAVLLLLLVSACGRAAQNRLASSTPDAPDVPVTAHYCLVAENIEDYQWRRLFLSTAREGLKQGVFVEAMNDDLPTDYTKQDLLKAAIACKPDGIFLEGDNTEETAALIDKATQEGIPVITLMADAENSSRICHIESGNYHLGRAYGRQIIQAAKELNLTGQQDVLVIVDDALNRQNRSSAISAMMEVVAAEGEGLSLNVNTETAEEGVFTSAQAIRIRILSVDRIPDFIILFSEQDTLNAYQVLVDYNRIGDVTMIGCSSSETILNAVARGAVHSVIVTEEEELAENAIEAMETFRTTGHVSEYIAADTIVIDREVAERMMNEDAQ